MKQLLRCLLILAFTALACISCESDEMVCMEPDIYPSTLSIQVRDTTYITNDTIVDSAVYGFHDTLFNSLRIISLDVDTPIASESYRSARIAFLLNPGRDSMRYILQFDTAQSISSTFYDTLIYYYEPRLQFISNTCGYGYYYLIRDVKYSSQYIDSMVIVNPNITNAASAVHVSLYFND